MEKMKLLLGGSPCTHWSIARTKNRETEPEGLGWELFKNYLIALEKFKPDFFLYENNKSMAPAIRAQITRELGVEPILINSALVSAQSRQRLYWTNIPGVEQPEDLGILLRDILESGLPLEEKGYTLKANYANAGAVNGVCGQHFPAPMATEPVRIGTIESNAKNADFDSQQYRVYSPDGKSVTLCGQGGGVGAKTGLYADPANGKAYPVYEVKDSLITIKGQQYPIRLADGLYIIRKLTVTECKRLQTVPEDYEFPVSNTQAYKMLGNGWTVDVIAHILSYCPGIRDVPLEVLSMYDGMSCGRLALNKLGARISHYYASEIDKYAIKTTQANFPDTVQLGDAFQVRDDGWSLPGLAIEETVAEPAAEVTEKPEQDGDHIAAPAIITERSRNCVLSLSYGKDSLACLGAIEELGWPLDRIIHAEVWATDTIPADLPPMMEFKAKADAIIKKRWGIEVEHISSGTSYHELFYRKIEKRKVGNSDWVGKIRGFPFVKGPWCNRELKIAALSKAQKGADCIYIGIAVDEPARFHNLTANKKSPLADAGWTEGKCRQWCEENGLLSPIYTDSARSGCWFCHNQGLQQLRLLRRNYPTYWKMMLEWDSESTVPFRADGHTVHDLEKRFKLEDQGLISPDDKVFRWSMLEEPLNFRLF